MCSDTNTHMLTYTFFCHWSTYNSFFSSIISLVEQDSFTLNLFNIIYMWMYIYIILNIHIYTHTILSELRSGEDTSKFLKLSPWFSDWSVTAAAVSSVTLQWKQLQSQQQEKTQDAGGLNSTLNWNFIPLSVWLLPTHTLHVHRIIQNKYNFLLFEISKCILGHSGVPWVLHRPGLPLSISIELTQNKHPAKDHQAKGWNKNWWILCVWITMLIVHWLTTGTSKLRRRNKSKTSRQESSCVGSLLLAVGVLQRQKNTWQAYGKLDFLFLQATT